ncbi:Predicted ATP-binding protein involved in virulence [Achromobacter insolitus]|uniref:AAA family ATPase n=1 Tax=Achromobacter insolitus TaxID=217204 RepID=UPI000972CA6A|nr:AAA family ATPase [Achromobacter insolitus]APX75087.1 hypothetical protein BUW96_09495 [Achromobacter insolitus]OWT58739.1 hypothetical protein CEY08_18730 [Achromobacter insolitus]CAB3716285.1 hypothetical protein LMG6003_03512 [Achromobacter insolitus]VEG67747.1 Predicted ATP-binding protein involved in virulence [Achromobacter insolitus]
MSYRESNLDRRCRERFDSNYNQMLRAVKLIEGRLRGLKPFRLELNFPITAIAGKNGSGKSTLLAMVCCAFHSSPGGFKLARRSKPYYRFSDFFMQRNEEGEAADTEIFYTIAHNDWAPDDERPDGNGLGDQRRWKKKGGKWNDYDRRIERNVVFLGIERVVPHIERSQSRSYRQRFKAGATQSWEDQARRSVSFVLNRTYVSFGTLSHQRYTLPIVSVGKTTYSGFNMGAGENALFDIFSTIYRCGANALIVIDEIELGLHVAAQRRLIEELKRACVALGCQIVCTTHSKEIFDSLPDDARVLLESRNGSTIIQPGVTSQYAFAKMGGKEAHELEIMVEDNVAKTIVLNALDAELRTRVKVTQIGSAGVLTRQLAATYLRKEKIPILVVFDGEQRNLASKNAKTAAKLLETEDPAFAEWFAEHSCYLPGDTWPEAWLVQKMRENVEVLAGELKVDQGALVDAIEEAQQAGKHNEFYSLSESLGFNDRSNLLSIVSSKVSQLAHAEFANLMTGIQRFLK